MNDVNTLTSSVVMVVKVVVV